MLGYWYPELPQQSRTPPLSLDCKALSDTIIIQNVWPELVGLREENSYNYLAVILSSLMCAGLWGWMRTTLRCWPYVGQEVLEGSSNLVLCEIVLGGRVGWIHGQTEQPEVTNPVNQYSVYPIQARTSLWNGVPEPWQVHLLLCMFWSGGSVFLLKAEHPLFQGKPEPRLKPTDNHGNLLSTLNTLLR